jgi:hypothetical protein
MVSKTEKVREMIEKTDKIFDYIEQETCVMCGGEAKDFRNEKSAREFQYTGICQQCQDDMFREDS